MIILGCFMLGLVIGMLIMYLIDYILEKKHETYYRELERDNMILRQELYKYARFDK